MNDELESNDTEGPTLDSVAQLGNTEIISSPEIDHNGNSPTFSGSQERENTEPAGSPKFERRVSRFQNTSQLSMITTNQNATEAFSTTDAHTSRLSPTKSKQKKANCGTPIKSEEEDGQTCTICFESWTNSGDHRLSSLKCGHIFGKKCIETWLSGGNGMRCPQCNAKAAKKDIRILFAKSLKVLDTSERDRLAMELDKVKSEKKQLEREHAQIMIKCELNNQLVKKLQEELRMLKASISTNDIPTGDIPKSYKLVFSKSFDICKDSACRVMAYSEWLNMLVVSVQSQIVMFPGFGIKKINLFDMKMHRYVPLHQKQIRDLCFNKVKHEILLSVSIDKTIKITNVCTNTVVQQYTSTAGIWSCSWKGDSSTEFFVGTAHGNVLLYDTTNTTDLPQTFTLPGSGPAVSLNYITYSDQTPEGILITRLNTMCFMETNDKMHTLNIDGLYVGSSYDLESGNILVSCRPSQKFPHARHILCTLNKLSQDNSEYDVVDREVHSFSGSSTMKAMARSSIVFSCLSNTWVLICEESAMCCKLYDGSNTALKQRIDLNANIIDALMVRVEDCHYIALLSEKHVKLYKWTEQL